MMNAQEVAWFQQCRDALARIECECAELRQHIARALSPSPIADGSVAPVADVAPTIPMIPIRRPVKTYVEKSGPADMADILNHGRFEDVK